MSDELESHKKPFIDWKKEFINLWGYFEYIAKLELDQERKHNIRMADVLYSVKKNIICKAIYKKFGESINRNRKHENISEIIFQDNLAKVIINIFVKSPKLKEKGSEYRWNIAIFNAEQIWKPNIEII